MLLGHVYCGMDTRSHKECLEFEDQKFDVRSISGNITMPGFTAPKINWIKKNEPENFKKIDKVLLPKDIYVFTSLVNYFQKCQMLPEHYGWILRKENGLQIYCQRLF